MSAAAAGVAPPPLQGVRLMLCVLPDDGTDRELIRALRENWGIDVADSVACRGVSVLREVRTRAGRLPESTFVRLLQVIVPEASAAALFDDVYARARIGRPGGGMVLLSKPIHATPFSLPQGLPEEAG